MKHLMVGGALLVGSFFFQAGLSSRAPKMSMGFTTQALRLLRLAGDYDGSPKAGIQGTRITDRELLDVFDSVSDVARSKEELQTVTIIRQFAAAKMHNNDGREESVARSWEAWEIHHRGADEDFRERAREANKRLVYARRIIQEMTERENACRVELDAMLRSGFFRKPVKCGAVAVDYEADLLMR